MNVIEILRELYILHPFDANKILYSDKEFIKNAFLNEYKILDYMCNEFKKDANFLLELYEKKLSKKYNNMNLIKYLYNFFIINIKDFDKYFINLLNITYEFFPNIPIKYHNKKIVRFALLNGENFLFLNKSLKNNKDFVLYAFKNLEDYNINRQSSLNTFILYNYKGLNNELVYFIKDDKNIDMICAKKEKNIIFTDYFKKYDNKKDLFYKLIFKKYDKKDINIIYNEYIVEYLMYYLGIISKDVIKNIEHKILFKKKSSIFNSQYLQQIVKNKKSMINALLKINQISKNCDFFCSLEQLLSFFEYKKDVIIHLIKYNIYITHFLYNYLLNVDEDCLKILAKNFFYQKNYEKLSVREKNYLSKKYSEFNEEPLLNINYYILLAKNGYIQSSEIKEIMDKKFLSKLEYYYSKNLFENVDERFRNNVVFPESMLFNNNIYKLINQYNITKEIDIIIEEIKKNPTILFYLNNIQESVEKILELIRKGCDIYHLLRDEYKYNIEIFYESAKKDKKIIKHADIKYINEYVKQKFNLDKTYEMVKKYNVKKFPILIGPSYYL